MNDKFMGEYTHSIDQKGRLIIPSKFRELLGEKFVVTKGMDGCLWIFSSKSWDEFTNNLQNLQTSSANVRKVKRYFFAGATETETDKQGRILLPQSLRAHAKLEKDVVLAGVSDKIEIWDADEWAKISNVDDVEDVAENMGELGFGF